MKKTLALILSSAMLLSIVSCSQTENTQSGSTTGSSNASTTGSGTSNNESLAPIKKKVK